MIRPGLFIVAAVLVDAASAFPQQAPTYLDPIDLGTLGGRETRAYAESNGRIVGASQTGDGATHAFKYENGVMTDLGTLGGTFSVAFAINATGSVAGSATVGDDAATHAFLWTEVDGVVDLGTLGGTYSRAAAINDTGQVAGWAQVPGDTAYHAFLWDPGAGMQDVGTFGGDSSFAYDINNVGSNWSVCGEAADATGASHAFVARASGLTDLGTFGGTYSAAIKCGPGMGLRPILGESSIADDSATHAVFWDGAGIHDLGTLGGAHSRALLTSPYGEVFGESDTLEDGTHPFRLWGGLVDFSHVLGEGSRVERVTPATDGHHTILSGAVTDGDDVHAFIASPVATSVRSIASGALEEAAVTNASFSFVAADVTASIRLRFYSARCNPCRAGDEVALSIGWTVVQEATGSATVRGISYPSIPIPWVEYHISSDTVTVPTSGEQSVTFTAPFTYSGLVRGTMSNGQNRVPDYLFSVPLTGAGEVTLELSSPDGRLYYDRQLRYSFSPQP
jgi:probable HAF family extracellular repeat protein